MRIGGMFMLGKQDSSRVSARRRLIPRLGRPPKVMVLLLALGLAVSLIDTAVARPPLPEAGMATKRSVTVDVAGYEKQHGPHYDFECSAPSGGANTNLDCDDPFPNNEPDIEVNPANPLNMIASSNDYGSCCDQYYTTLDGGLTWSTGN